MKAIYSKLINCKYRNILAFLLSSILTIIIAMLFFYGKSHFLDKSIIVFSCLICLNVYLFNDKEKMNNFIYKYRYLIGLTIFALLVVGKFHGSSISIYDSVIQGSTNTDINIFGHARGIRGDSWVVGIPTTLSQVYNNFKVNGNIISGTMRNLLLYPAPPTFHYSILFRLANLGYLFLPVENAFSFAWYFGYFMLFYATFELLMILLNKKRLLALLGAILVTFSPAVMWWESWNIIAYGEIVVILIYYFFLQKSIIRKIIIAFLTGIFGSAYIMTLYPAWMLPYGYIFLGIVLWILFKNKEKINVKSLCLLVGIVLAIVPALIIPVFVNSKAELLLTSHTSYPGGRISLGGEAWQKLFNYLPIIFASFHEPGNSCEMAQFLSLYPLPIVLGIYYSLKSFKNRKKDFLLIWFTILLLFLTFWNYLPFPKLLARLSFMYMSTPQRTTIVAGYLSILLMLYLYNNYYRELKSYTFDFYKFAFAFIMVTFGIYVVKISYGEYIIPLFEIIDLCLFVPIMYFLLSGEKKRGLIALIILTLVSFCSTIFIHPINKGLGSFYNKPLSKEIVKINKKDKIWATVSTPYYVQNYIMVSGARTLNSTNYFPNDKLWKKLKLNKEYKDIYNRYAHITINIVEDETNVELLYQDHIILNINNEDLCGLNIDYLVTNGLDLNVYDDSRTDYTKIYDEDGMNIFELSCEK